MPSVSERQRRYLFATKGEAWVKAHHFDRLDTAARLKRRKRKRKAKP